MSTAISQQIAFNKALVKEGEKISPVLARYFRRRVQQLEPRTGGNAILQFCIFCHNQFSEGNYSVKLRPRSKLTAKIKKLLTRWETDPGTLGKFQQKLVTDYHNSANKLVIRCYVCKKVNVITGQTRSQVEERKLQQRMKLETPEPIKTKSQKKKEKKKVMMKKKLLRLEEEKNAGLSLPVVDDDDNHKQMNNEKDEDHIKEKMDSSALFSARSLSDCGVSMDVSTDFSNSPIAGLTETDSNSNKINSVANETVSDIKGADSSEKIKSKSDKTSPNKRDNSLSQSSKEESSWNSLKDANFTKHGPIVNNDLNEKPAAFSSIKQKNLGKKGGNQPVSIKVAGNSSKTSKGMLLTEKKKKGMKMTAALSKMLKKEKTEGSSGEGSLADFLSTL